jgi:hypothetical protein
MPQHRDPCIFCKEDKPLTRQHVWPAWLEKLFPHPQKSATNFFQTQENRTSAHGISISTRTKIRQGYLLSVKYRKVCAQCNNVWLSGLEEAVKPIVEKLISGIESELTSEDQSSLALWISIVAIMAELTHPENMGIPASVPNRVYQSKSPLPFSRIYLGQYLGSEYAPYRYRHRAGVLISPQAFHQGLTTQKIPNCQTSVFVLGELLVVVDSTDEEHYSDFAQTRTGAASPLSQIHPLSSNSIRWPPTGPVGDASLDLICVGRFLSFYDPLSINSTID